MKSALSARLADTLRFLLLSACCAGICTAQDSNLDQDALDLTARANLVQGSGARAFGMAGAFLARADDATAASWNPAGLSYLRQPELSIVGASNSFRTSSLPTANAPVAQDDRLSGNTPDFLAVTYPVQPGSLSGAIQISFQRVISLTGGRTIDRPNTRLDLNSNGGFDVLAFGTGLRVTRNLRVGATLNHWFNGFRQSVIRIKRVNPRVEDQTDFALSGWNTNLGLIWAPNEFINLGAVYKTPFTGRVTLSKSSTNFFDVPQSNQHSSDAVRVDFPSAIGFGISVRPRNALTLSADYTRTVWSKARIHNYFSLPPALVNGTRPEPTVFPELSYPSLNRTDQSDTQQIRLGIEYVILTRRTLKIPVRAGYLDDRQFFQTQADFLGYAFQPRQGGHAPHFYGFTVGTGVVVGPVLFDVAYLFETGKYTDVDQFQVRAHRVLVSFIVRRGGA